MVLLPSLFFSCTSSSGLLADTPIIGGTEEVRALLRDELAAFDEATGYGRTRVSRIHLKPKPSLLGRFHTVTRSISLDEDVEPLFMTEVLRHELCHALNIQENLHYGEEALYRRLAAGFFSSGLAIEGRCESEPCQEHEIFATYCQMGPWISHALAQGCPGDPEDGIAILRQLSEDLWINAEQPLPTVPQDDWASLELGGTSEYARVRATVSPDVIKLAWVEEDSPYDAYYDVHSGEVAGSEELLGEPLQPPAGLPVDLTALDVYDSLWFTPTGWTEGPYTTTVEIDVYDLGSTRRHVWYDGERWWLTGDGCVQHEVEPFIAADRVFTLRLGESRISWGSVEP